jgi:TctA family transporter
MDVFLQAITLMFQWQNLAALMGGALYGIIIGILPGWSSRRHGSAFLWFQAGLLSRPLFVVPLQMLQLRRFHYRHFGQYPGDASMRATILDGYPM